MRQEHPFEILQESLMEPTMPIKRDLKEIAGSVESMDTRLKFAHR
jgi:hypothetical protein